MHRTLLSKVKMASGGGGGDEPEEDQTSRDLLAHSLALLWKQLVITMDRSIYDYKQRYDKLHSKFEQKVKEKIDEAKERFETERLTL